MDFSFWNYGTPSTYYGTAADAVKEWKELGITIAFSFFCNADPKHHAFTRELLDECEKAGIKVIINDSRTHFTTLRDKGMEEYRKAVSEAEKEFGSHPAVFGWYVGDEPPKKNEEIFKEAVSVIRELSEKEPFVNFYPCKSTNKLADQFGFGTVEDYYAGVERMSEKLGIVSYDRYSQFAVETELNFRQLGIDNYFLNLLQFRALAKKSGKKAWVSLLSTGHWNYADLTETAIRWQINTAFACGMDCVQWFTVYQYSYTDSFWGYPVSLKGRKKPHYYDIAEITDSFKHRIDEPLKGFEFDGVWSVGKGQLGFEPLTKTVEAEWDFYAYHHVCGLVTRFADKDGKRKYVLTNIDQEFPEVFGFIHNGKQLLTKWLPPGGNCLVDPEALIKTE